MLEWMSARAVRFRPPPPALTPAVRWMLLRAFGPPGAPRAPGVPVDAGEAVALCRRFDLAARVAARQGRERLAGELGEDAAQALARERARAAAAGLRLAALAERVAALAAARDLPVVFLKFAALDLRGLLVPGSRSACDLDVLPAAGRAAELQETLVAAGFAASPMPSQEHQLAALAGPDGIVEVHRIMLGVRLHGGRSATADDLAAAGLLAPLPALPGRAAVPAPAAAAAHALVHGIAQHGWAPASYPPLKMAADLIDLGWAGEEGPAQAAQAAHWVAGEVTAAEVEAARRLACALAAGEDAAGWAASSAGEALLLRHALAGELDQRYRRSLRLSLFRRQPSDRREPARLARLLARTVWLSRAQVDAIYGPPRHPAGYLARQLGRPLDLLARLGRYGRAAWRLHRGRS